MWLPRWYRRLRRRRVDAEAMARDNPWRRLPLAPPLPAYGPGADREFAEYLAGDSRVRAATPHEIAGWLLACRYVDDRTLLDEPDHWQHPRTFEIVRCGDCEDFSLWAWRKLLEASYDADFVVGNRHRPDGSAGRHAWVMYREGRDEFVFDAVERSLSRIIRVRTHAAAEYEPQVGVNARGVRFAFAGLYRTTWGPAMILDPHD
jgi:hypothetical protein